MDESWIRVTIAWRMRNTGLGAEGNIVNGVQRGLAESS
jgi:hypothetical protein